MQVIGSKICYIHSSRWLQLKYYKFQVFMMMLGTGSLHLLVQLFWKTGYLQKISIYLVAGFQRWPQWTVTLESRPLYPPSLNQTFLLQLPETIEWCECDALRLLRLGYQKPENVILDSLTLPLRAQCTVCEKQTKHARAQVMCTGFENTKMSSQTQTIINGQLCDEAISVSV